MFAVREKIIEKYDSEIKTVVSSYHASLRCLETEKRNVVSKAKAKYPDIVYDINSYFDRLRYKFDEDLKKALMFYFSIAGDMGLIKKVSKLKFLDIE